jgi:flagellar hook-associated protein 1 FlgK
VHGQYAIPHGDIEFVNGRCRGDTRVVDEDIDLAEFGGGTIYHRLHGAFVGDVGFDVAAAQTTLGSQESLLAQLQAERESISGVNIDEEMVDLMRFQQSYEAAARFLSVAQEMTDTLINLGR